MIDESFLNQHASAFEDFWNRRRGDSFFELTYPGYGYEIHVETNHPSVLDAARLAAARYCRSARLPGEPTMEFRVLVVPSLPDTPVPADFPSRLQTVSVGDYMFQAATPWIQWFADLKERRMYALLSPAMPSATIAVSRNVFDRSTLNILLREGVGQLHSTTLVRDDCAVLFIAPHGTGKSTTAFQLLNTDFRLMGDGHLFIRERSSSGTKDAGEFELMGYPVGEAKLTEAAKPLFPEWHGEGIEVTVHNVVKHIVNLRALAPNKMIDTSVFPKRIILCLAERNGQPLTSAERLDSETALTRLLPDTIFWDDPEPMMQSLNVIKRLVEHAECYRLTLGADRQQLVEKIQSLAA
jgi:hypothetical protein